MEEPYGYQREGVDWTALGQRLSRHCLRVIGSIMLTVALAVIYLHFATYKYSARMRVAPVAGASSDGLSSKLGQLGGLAAVAGVALPDGGGNASFKLYVEAVHSRDTAERLVKDRELMRRVFVKEWNPTVRQWQRPTSMLSESVQPIKNLLGVPTYAWKPPGAARLQEFIEKNVKVEQNSKSPVVSISIQYEDAKLAVDLLAGINKVVDGMLRERTLLRTDDYIRYLSGKLSTAALLEQRSSIALALGEQERVKMVASSTRPFAADLFEAPSVSDRPVTPKPYAVLAIAGILGLAVGVGLALLPMRAGTVEPISSPAKRDE